MKNFTVAYCLQKRYKMQPLPFMYLKKRGKIENRSNGVEDDFTLSDKNEGKQKKEEKFSHWLILEIDIFLLGIRVAVANSILKAHPFYLV